MVRFAAILAVAALLTLMAAAACANGWKWGSNHAPQQQAGWTWDDTTAAWIDTA